MRYDQDWVQHTDGYTWDEYDGAKGVELIPWYKTELIIQAPPYYNYPSWRELHSKCPTAISPPPDFDRSDRAGIFPARRDQPL